MQHDWTARRFFVLVFLSLSFSCGRLNWFPAISFWLIINRLNDDFKQIFYTHVFHDLLNAFLRCVCERATSTSFSSATPKCRSCGRRSSRLPETATASVTSWTRGRVRWDFPSSPCATWREASTCWIRLDFLSTQMTSTTQSTVPTGNYVTLLWHHNLSGALPLTVELMTLVASVNSK